MRKFTACILRLVFILFSFHSPLSQAASLSDLNILIPAGQGGGWDTTAREAGNTLQQLNLVETANYTNLSGNGGGRALSEIINNTLYRDHLMVQSLPLIMRNISGQYDHSFRDILPVAIMIAEYQVVVVTKDSPFQNMNDLLAAIKEHGKKKPLVGGSAKGSLDHITALAVLEAADIPSSKLRYSPSNGGGDAIRKFSVGYALAMVTGLGEVIDQVKSGEFRILGITSEQRIEGLNAPTMKEQGINVILANWRGFFASRKVNAELLNTYKGLLADMNLSQEWKQTRQKYGWEPFYITSDNAEAFLQTQERTISKFVKNID
ncbi:tripartite tricarboxylate transporter substrate binding protein [Hahella ganghwensis]|uniref:tripartite tricarboxylate transporter substrate binding protein n=1 Tax=Hahella ganghwensis TaxID=286420 RepID=UPI00037707FB|nr:tripartite tricarboxylate transporter substrate-binding protein [Hahella ganghwensis]